MITTALPAIAAPPGPAIVGTVETGSTPVTGATLNVYAATSGAPTLLATTTTDSSGSFSVRVNPPASGDAVIYVRATGGSVGGTPNNAIDLVAVLGPASGIGHHNAVTVNELTTVAAAWSLAHFINAGAISGPLPELQNASATVPNLVNLRNGGDASFLTSGANSPQRLNTVANIIAACVNQAQCSNLPAPTDTLTSAVDMALNPATHVASLFGLIATAFAGTPPYTPSLATAPTDFTIGLNFTGGGLSVPMGIAIDSAGNVWVANEGGDSVTEMGPDGSFLSGHSGYTSGGMNEPKGLAIDPRGNVWVANYFGSSVTELNSSGTAVANSPFMNGGVSAPLAVAADSSGNIWISDAPGGTGGGVTEFPAGNPASAVNLTGVSGAGYNSPAAIAVNGNSIWVANSGNNSLTLLDILGTSATATSFTPIGLSSPHGLAIDASGNVWISSYLGGTVAEVDSNGNQVTSSPFSGGGLSSPAGVAIDSAGDVWVANANGVGSVTELGSDGVPVSPDPSGFTGGVVNDSPYALAIDSAGNVWVSNSGLATSTPSITELLSAAAPVKTPLNGLPTAP